MPWRLRLLLRAVLVSAAALVGVVVAREVGGEPISGCKPVDRPPAIGEPRDVERCGPVDERRAQVLGAAGAVVGASLALPLTWRVLGDRRATGDGDSGEPEPGRAEGYWR